MVYPTATPDFFTFFKTILLAAARQAPVWSDTNRLDFCV